MDNMTLGSSAVRGLNINGSGMSMGQVKEEKDHKDVKRVLDQQVCS
jgi:hypothetical protein